MQWRGSRPTVRSRRGVGLRVAMMAADGGAEEEAQHGAASWGHRGGARSRHVLGEDSGARTEESGEEARSRRRTKTGGGVRR